MHPGNRLRELRKDKGLTQSDLAELTGVSQPAISQIENGVLSIDIQWLHVFARVLGCVPADLLDDNDNPDRLSPDERALIERLRGADNAARKTVARIVDAVLAPVVADISDAKPI
jgi:transcriptional regulator with XRE-family HTH domain